MKKNFGLVMAMASCYSVSGYAAEAGEQLPAVSGINAKASVYGGSLDGDRLGTGQGSVTLPMGDRFGFQADALVSKVDGDDVRGLAAHAFWRNPDVALFGIVASALEVDDIRVERFGVEGDYFTKSFTFSANVGTQGGDVDSASYGRAEVTYYPTDNVALVLAGTKADDDDRTSLDIEYQTSVSGLALFASTEMGSDNYDATHAGVRFYFGADKSLKRRHREDDPKNPLLPMLSSTISAINEVQVQNQVDEVLGLLDGLGVLDDLLGSIGLDGLTDALGGLGLDGLGDVLGGLGDGLPLDEIPGLGDLFGGLGQ